MLPVFKVVSGGQTGVDRAALDVAIFLGLEHGGWCPRGRLAEDGVIPAVYRLQETDSTDYAVRTERNVVESDGTLIVHRGPLGGGTALTLQLARRHRRPLRQVDLSRASHPQATQEWLVQQGIAVLNVAGPRASSDPGLAAEAEAFLLAVLAPNRRVDD